MQNPYRIIIFITRHTIVRSTVGSSANHQRVQYTSHTYLSQSILRVCVCGKAKRITLHWMQRQTVMMCSERLLYLPIAMAIEKYTHKCFDRRVQMYYAKLHNPAIYLGTSRRNTLFGISVYKTCARPRARVYVCLRVFRLLFFRSFFLLSTIVAFLFVFSHLFWLVFPRAMCACSRVSVSVNKWMDTHLSRVCAFCAHRVYAHMMTARAFSTYNFVSNNAQYIQHTIFLSPTQLNRNDCLSCACGSCIGIANILSSTNTRVHTFGIHWFLHEDGQKIRKKEWIKTTTESKRESGREQEKERDGRWKKKSESRKFTYKHTQNIYWRINWKW